MELNYWGLYNETLAALTDAEFDPLIDVVDDRRLFVVAEALCRGYSEEKLNERTGITLYFCQN